MHEGHAERADVEAVFRAAAGEPAGGVTGGDRPTLFPYWQYVRRAGGAGSSDVGAALVAARPGGGKTVRRGPHMGRRISHGEIRLFLRGCETKRPSAPC